MPFSLFTPSKQFRHGGASAGTCEAHPPAETEAPEEPAPEVTRAAVAECLKYVVDPEVGINIVDLGLVYDLQVELPSISLKLTMTTPACPMSSHITRHARALLERIRGTETVEVELVWQPAWSPQMMDAEVSRRHFGGRFTRR